MPDFVPTNRDQALQNLPRQSKKWQFPSLKALHRNKSNDLVRFRKQFSTPGPHYLDVRLTLQPEEEDSEPKHYGKVFLVQVCPR